MTSDTDTRVSTRESAALCGQVHREVMQMVPQLAKLSEDELTRRAEADLAKLRDRGRLTGPEVEQLVDLGRVTLSPAMPREKFEQVDSLRRQLDTSSAGPYAVAIAADSSLNQVLRLEEEGEAADVLHAAARYLEESVAVLDIDL